MADELWNAMVPTPHEAEVGNAFERVRGRVAERRVQSRQRRRLLALAAAFALTFGAGWMAGRATQLPRAGWDSAQGGHFIGEGRATFVAVPATDQ